MKRILCMSLIVIMLATLLTGCFSKKSTNYSNNNTNYNDFDDSNEQITEENEESLADSCQYILATGYDNDGTCYQLVGEDYESYDKSIIRFGVIKNNQWLVEMTSDVPFLDEYNCIYGSQSLHNDYILEGYGTLKNATSDSKSDFYNRFGYIGNGCFYLLGVERDTSGYYIENNLSTIVFWNTEKKNSKIVNNITMSDMENYVQDNEIVISELVDYDFRLSNDAFALLDIKLLNPETFETKKIFSQKLTIENNMSNSVHQISDGLFYANGSFYNADGSKAFDLAIKNIHEIGHFNDGKCEIITQIDTGTKYIVTIDKTGKVISDEKID